MNRFITAAEQRAILPRGHGRMQALIDWARNRTTRAVARRRERFMFRALAAAATVYLDMFANRSFEIGLNGELRVLESLAELAPMCVFDVGANVGDWSLAAAALFPDAQIHAFEIVPDTARLMQERLLRSGVSSVTVNAAGLSDETGTVKVAYLPSFSQGSSAVVVQPGGSVQWRECSVQTGDEYCRAHTIEHIDILKVDVEGLEDKVLKGFEGMLRTSAVDVVQFEYGQLNASVRFLLGDFYDLLEGYGYSVGKVFPDHVDFRHYDPWRDEDFRGPNYVAVHRGRADLIRKLSNPNPS